MSRSAAGRDRRRLAAGLAVLAVLAFFVVRSIKDPEDFQGYVEVGRLVREGKHPYHDARPGVSTWPPAFTVVTVPASLLDDVSPWLARGLWLALIAAGLLMALREIARLVHGKPLVLVPREGALALGDPVLVIPLVLLVQPVFGSFLHLQIGTIVLAMVLVALRLDAQGRSIAGGLLLGAAAALRVMPIVFLPWWAWRGRGKAALAGALACALLTVLPAVWLGPERFADHLRSWWATLGGDTWGVGKMNQSIPAVLDRWIGHGVVPFVSDRLVSLQPSGDPLVRALSLGLLGLVALLGLMTFRRRLRPDGPAMLAEWSVLFLVAAAFGPVCWKSYLVVALLPLTLLLALDRDVRQPPGVRRVARWTWRVSGMLYLLPNPDILGKELAGALELAGLYAFGTLFLLVGLFVLRPRLGALELADQRTAHA